jgi:hypothetical protein
MSGSGTTGGGAAGGDLPDAEAAFAAHLKARAAAARARYGPIIDAAAIRRLLADRDVVRWPTELCFDAGPLRPGEFAYPQPLGFHPRDGFCLFVHPHFEHRPDDLPLLVAYHIPSINYGGIVEARHAELYGATLLGLDVEAYYRALCALADSMPRR